MAKEWVKLEEAEVFKKAALDGLDTFSATDSSAMCMPINLMAYDGCGRILVWNSKDKLLHSVDVQDSNTSHAESVYATRDFKTWKLSSNATFPVRALKFNRTGHLLLLVGDRAMMVVYVTSQACRSVMVASDMFNGRSLRILHVAWHPYSDSHVGVLSSDGVFRLFNLAGEASVPEQEYHLQTGFRSSKTFIRPVAFAFGGEHFWDRFTVFILFTDASTYTLCPIVPFGSLHSITSLKELTSQLSSNTWANEKESSTLAAAWLEIVFPELGKDTHGESLVIKARSQVPFNASLVLQGPLPKLWGDNNTEKLTSYATGILYNTAGKDSILTVCTRNGELLFYALADEVQPLWNMQNAPKIHLDDFGDLITLGMLVEPQEDKNTSQLHLEDKELIGQTPPLLLLASVDLLLGPTMADASPMGVLSDPLVPERIYCHHALGLDTVQLQFLPFSDASSGQGVRPPLVSPVLDASPMGNSDVTVPLLGATLVLLSSGETWLVALTASGKCIVIQMKPHTPLPPVSITEDSSKVSKGNDSTALKLLNPELLRGPKDIHISMITSSTPLTLDTVEGRSVLHDQCKLLHEKYIEYAHRVYVELKSHQGYLGQVVQDLEKQLHRTSVQILQAQEGSDVFLDRIHQAFEKNRQLQERIRECNKLPALKQKVLTIAERDLKELLDTKMNQDIDILQMAVESLTLRAKKKESKNIPGGYSRVPRLMVPENQMRALRKAMNRLVQHIELSGKRLEILEQAVRRKESQHES